MIYALFADLLCIRKAKTFNNIVGVIVGVTIHFPTEDQDYRQHELTFSSQTHDQDLRLHGSMSMKVERMLLHESSQHSSVGSTLNHLVPHLR
ncbi:hypothetical protein C8Q76DRAFT_790704 [Earliella scabrosa]|nr:hypothetical protein C8Q76DRAFT_790704 [Earliella scabrosa]